MPITTLLLCCVAGAVVAILYLLWRLQQAGNARERGERQEKETAAVLAEQVGREKQALEEAHRQQLARYQSIVDVEAERRQIQAETEAERVRVLAELDAARQRAEDDKQRIISQAETLRRQTIERLNSQQTVIQVNLQRLKESEQDSQRNTDEMLRRISELRTELHGLDEQAELQSFGFYQARYSFDTSMSYQLELAHIRESQKRMVVAKTAATCETDWTVNGSVTEGRKQTNQTLKLMLRAFNGECDAAVAKVKYNNVTVMEARIRKAYDIVNALTAVQQATLAPTYLELKLKELYLAHEYQEKAQAEKEEQRQIREQMREEELAQREIEKARLDAEKEEKRYAEALRKAQEEVGTAAGARQAKLLAEIALLQQKLEQASVNKARALSRAQITRSGHVYVISNVGSFGEDVYKIGMTRRLEPLDRVRELGDASVPFHFDVHAVIYCDDAPGLETKLHRLFHTRRVNQVNHRKEFFRISLPEIADAVLHNHGEIEFTLAAEAAEYRKTVSLLTATDQIPL